MDSYVAGIGDIEEGDKGCGVCGIENREEGREGVISLVDGDRGRESSKPFILGLGKQFRVLEFNEVVDERIYRARKDHH